MSTKHMDRASAAVQHYYSFSSRSLLGGGHIIMWKMCHYQNQDNAKSATTRLSFKAAVEYIFLYGLLRRK